MTEEPTTDPTVSTDQRPADADDTRRPPGGDQPSSDAKDADDNDAGRSAVEYLEWGALTVLALVALVATFRLYFSVSAAVDTFVTRRYRPLFMAGFNLVVLLACGIGLSTVVRRLS
ncbi:hypothetical protein [Haloarcula nitratireducens]|uniref:DUF8060 domain-containing protein n=1 Tax=Haloarcula nitratireducens TaxID=2487749 RepID=A0AAW4P8P0_9EURY|nr:hypothetical protein [Halomicroarcula nitratireducens]MBX0294229.1 hypothetical protein [Halomicroarcula nitratireducens]